MASSCRYWPSMFKSKPCNSHHHQWRHDISSSSFVSSGCNRTPYSSVGGCEERSPEPKPRWNPKPEQIRILEAIFNSGLVNPPRYEIRKIRAQLQEYGQVGDANVFYWFQNKKSRSKHKLRLLQNSSKLQQSSSIADLPAPSSSSSSSDKSSPNSSKGTLSLNSQTVVANLSNSPTASVSQTSYFQQHNELVSVSEPFLFPAQQPTGARSLTQGSCFFDLSNLIQAQDQTIGLCTSLLLSEIMNSDTSTKYHHQHHKNVKIQPQDLDYCLTTPITHTIGLAPPNFAFSTTDTHSVTIASTVNEVQGVEESAGSSTTAATSTVFINDVAFEVGVGPFNVREAFGDDFMLIHSTGNPVLTNDWGLTLHSLQHGASYYLVPLSMTQQDIFEGGKVN